MQNVKVKVCGMTQVNQVKEIVELGVHAIGVILHANSPRLIDIETAKMIREVIPESTLMVAVTVNASIDWLHDAHQKIKFDWVQLHGDEEISYVEKLKLPYIKAIRTKSESYIQKQMSQFGEAQAVLLDTYVKGIAGGTGKTFDKKMWPKKTSQKMILSGGINENNMADLVAQCNPYAVDLNSGVELSPGIKDIAAIDRCVHSVK